MTSDGVVTCCRSSLSLASTDFNHQAATAVQGLPIKVGMDDCRKLRAKMKCPLHGKDACQMQRRPAIHSDARQEVYAIGGWTLVIGCRTSSESTQTLVPKAHGANVRNGRCLSRSGDRKCPALRRSVRVARDRLANVKAA